MIALEQARQHLETLEMWPGTPILCSLSFS